MNATVSLLGRPIRRRNPDFLQDWWVLIRSLNAGQVSNFLNGNGFRSCPSAEATAINRDG